MAGYRCTTAHRTFSELSADSCLSITLSKLSDVFRKLGPDDDNKIGNITVRRKVSRPGTILNNNNNHNESFVSFETIFFNDNNNNYVWPSISAAFSRCPAYAEPGLPRKTPESHMFRRLNIYWPHDPTRPRFSSRVLKCHRFAIIDGRRRQLFPPSLHVENIQI